MFGHFEVIFSCFSVNPQQTKVGHSYSHHSDASVGDCGYCKPISWQCTPLADTVDQLADTVDKLGDAVD